MRGPTTAVSRESFYVFAAVRAEFWQKTVMYLRAVRELAFRHRTEEQHVRPKASAITSGVLYVFFNIKAVKKYIITIIYESFTVRSWEFALKKKVSTCGG